LRRANCKNIFKIEVWFVIGAVEDDDVSEPAMSMLYKFSANRFSDLEVVLEQ
jgi:hypothetical protein